MTLNFTRRYNHNGMRYGESAHKFYWDVANNVEATITAGLADCTTYARGRALEVGLPCPMNEKGDASKWHTKLINNWTSIQFDINKVQPGDIVEWSSPNNHVAFVEEIKDNTVYVSASWYTGINGKAYIDGKYDKRTGINSLQELSDLMFDKYLYRTFHYVTLETENNQTSGGNYPTYILKAPKKENKVGLFTKRTTKPTASNLEYVRTAKGGWSQCCLGNPTDSECDALANCVGYACGRFNEIYNEITGHKGMKYPYLNCNAENFIERVKNYYPELKISSEPQPGAIICWRKGEIANGNDGAGHVAVVEEILERDANGKAISIKTSESAYSGTTFFTATRTYNNGNWVNWKNYYFRAFILNPAVTDETIIVNPVDRLSSVDQIEVKIKTLRMRSNPSLNGEIYGNTTPGIYNVLDKAEADGYTWYKIGDKVWIADCDGEATEQVEFLPKYEWKKPEPVEKNTKQNQIYIGKNITLRIRKEASTSSEQMGLCEKDSYYKCLELSEKDDYTWYRIGEDAWCAGVGGVIYYSAKGEVVKGEDVVETPVSNSEEILAELEAKLKSVEEQIASLTSQLSATKAEAQETKAKLEETNKALASAEEKLSAIGKIIKE